MCVWLVGIEPTTFLVVSEVLYPLSYSHTHAKVSPDYILLIFLKKILWIKISCVKRIAISPKVDVKVHPRSQWGASPDVIVLPLSHRGVQYNLSYKKEPRREICGAFFYFTDVAIGITISLYWRKPGLNGGSNLQIRFSPDSTNFSRSAETLSCLIFAFANSSVARPRNEVAIQVSEPNSRRTTRESFGCGSWNVDDCRRKALTKDKCRIHFFSLRLSVGP